MQREIYEVTAKIVDANGNYSTASGFPKAFDSMSYNNDVTKARNRAYSAFHTILGTMYSVDSRQEQLAMIYRISDGVQEIVERVGDLAEIPDPEPEPEPEPTPEPEGE